HCHCRSGGRRGDDRDRQRSGRTGADARRDRGRAGAFHFAAPCRACVLQTEARPRRSRLSGTAPGRARGKEVSEPRDFLSRWSRRKQQAGKNKPDETADVASIEDAELAAAKEKEPGGEKKIVAADPKDATAETVFDISKLPPIESITATTDIRPF